MWGTNNYQTASETTVSNFLTVETSYTYHVLYLAFLRELLNAFENYDNPLTTFLHFSALYKVMFRLDRIPDSLKKSPFNKYRYICTKFNVIFNVLFWNILFGLLDFLPYNIKPQLAELARYSV